MTKKRGSSSERAFTDTSKTTFEKMGSDWAASDFVNMSGARSPYTTTTPKKGGKGKSPTGAKANRSGYQISEAQGPRCTIKVPLYKQNAPESSQTQRNLKTVPSCMGNRDSGFGSYRQYGQRV